MNIVLALLHEIEEHDQVKLLSELGYNVFSIGGYSDPVHHEGLRPALPDVPVFPDLIEACDRVRREMQAQFGPPEMHFDWAKYHLPDEVIDWMDVFIVHHAEHTFIPDQWERIKHKRVIWRSVGQSVENNENEMRPFRAQGLQRVAYSPKEQNIPGYIGHDALIRFYADPDEWYGWTGEDAHVANVTANLRFRDPFTNYGFWEAATAGLPRLPAGPTDSGWEVPDGLGKLSYDDMKAYLRRMRVYLYMGTQPASYTLGLIEAMMTGIPVISIPDLYMNVFPYSPALFEGWELAGGPFYIEGQVPFPDLVATTRTMLESFLRHEPDFTDGLITAGRSIADHSRRQRAKAIELFGKDKIAAEWRAFLG